MLKKEGERIEPGDVLARTKGIFGMFRTEYKAKVAGTIESISAVTGQVIVRGAPLPVQVKAYLTGTVVEVIPSEGLRRSKPTSRSSRASSASAARRSARSAWPAKRHDQELTDDLITPDMKGCVVVGGARVTAQAIEQARTIGVAAIVTGGIDDADLEAILGYDLGVAITGSERIGLTLIITEGFGEIAMAERTFDLLASRAGDDAAVNGATQIRAGVMRPEIVIPLPRGRAHGARAGAR